MSEFNLGHIDVSALGQGRTYGSTSSFRKKAIDRIRDEHGSKLVEAYDRAIKEAHESQTMSDISGLSPEMVVLEFELSPLAGSAKLNRKTEGTRQSAVKVKSNGTQTVALFVPEDKKDKLAKLLHDYTYGELKGAEGKEKKPPNSGRVAEIEDIRAATFETFWRDSEDALPSEPGDEMWWGLWCFTDRVDHVIQTAERLGCRVAGSDAHLHFPDATVVPVYGTKLIIEILLIGTVGIAEVRRASDSPGFFIQDVHGDEHAWIDDYAERVIWPPSDTPTVCVLDTGVNRAHPLLEPAVGEEVVDSVNEDWGADDHDGHGTGMAGLALHGDLTMPLGDNAIRELNHRAESVKILPPDGFNPNEPNSYGPITQSAVSIAEINNPDAPFRAFCLPVTNELRSGSDASAWSAAIDQAASGVMAGDPEENGPRRLFVISAGNIQDTAAKDALKEPDAFPAEDPSQAWNAITVGGVTDKSEITEDNYEGYTVWANPGELSPYSRTSNLWDERKSPAKPDLVFEAGNRAVSPAKTDIVAGLPSLSLLSTGADVGQNPFEPTWATSAAAAQCARMAAQISAFNAEYWPEMVRALMVHSAEWTGPMRAQFERAKNAGERADLIRRFGFGVPSLQRALTSSQSNLAVISQRYIQPFKQNGSDVGFNEAHVYPLPWPKGVLESLGDSLIRLKVTLSYFVEPNPSFSSSIDPFRYQSFGLRFDLKRSRETKAVFLKRVNRKERTEQDGKIRTAKDSGWLLGDKKVTTGSLHCDEWVGTAAELASRNMLWVLPVTGWWRERAALGRGVRKARYALVLTLESKEQEIDLHTPVSTMVDTLVDIPI